MTTSPPSKLHNLHLQNPKKQVPDEETEKTHLCDFCNKSIPLLYCRADSAKLCYACDRHVHSNNPLFSKHHRSHLCNSCESNPATILCSTHDLFLCQNCDFDAHQRSTHPHDRRPLEGFSGCPSCFEFASALGFEDKVLLGGKGDGGDDDDDDGGDWGVDGILDLDGWMWETTAAPVISVDDLIVPTTMKGSCGNLQAMGFSPPMKHRNVACGKRKEEILQQLRDLVKTETDMNDDCRNFDSVHELQCLVPEQNLQPQNMGTEYENDAVPIVVPGCEMQASAVQWHGNSYEATDQVSLPYKQFLESTIEESSLVLEGHTDIHGSGSHTNGDNKELLHSSFEEFPLVQSRGVYELTGHDRDTVISRYKEKKKTRRYDKHIRYESRKARADSRTRIKGRFAKVNQDQSADSGLRQVR